MEEKHDTGWIEVRSGNAMAVMGLVLGEKPETGFCGADTTVKARACCNEHGL